MDIEYDRDIKTNDDDTDDCIGCIGVPKWAKTAGICFTIDSYKREIKRIETEIRKGLKDRDKWKYDRLSHIKMIVEDMEKQLSEKN